MSQPASRKVYVSGSRPDLRVPMREVCLHGGEPPLRLYDTGGLWTDPEAHVDIKQGLPPLRLALDRRPDRRRGAAGADLGLSPPARR